MNKSNACFLCSNLLHKVNKGYRGRDRITVKTQALCKVKTGTLNTGDATHVCAVNFVIVTF